MLKHLNEVNDVKIRSVKDPEFAPFGRVVTGYDFSGLISYMESSTEIPESGNIYHASEPGLEADPVKAQVENGLYGGMEVEIGYCNGRNTTYNGFEYHKGSEINISCWHWATAGRSGTIPTVWRMPVYSLWKRAPPSRCIRPPCTFPHAA